jgi:hypothetical protein
MSAPGSLQVGAKAVLAVGRRDGSWLVSSFQVGRQFVVRSERVAVSCLACIAA